MSTGTRPPPPRMVSPLERALRSAGPPVRLDRQAVIEACRAKREAILKARQQHEDETIDRWLKRRDWRTLWLTRRYRTRGQAWAAVPSEIKTVIAHHGLRDQARVAAIQRHAEGTQGPHVVLGGDQYLLIRKFYDTSFATVEVADLTITASTEAPAPASAPDPRFAASKRAWEI